MARAFILGEYGTAQTEVRVICERDSFVLILDPEEKSNRPKEFIPESGVVRFDVRQNGWLHVIAGTINALTAHNNLSTMRNGLFYLFQ